MSQINGTQPTGRPISRKLLLNLPATKGKPQFHEKRLLSIAAMLRWEDQRGRGGKSATRLGCKSTPWQSLRIDSEKFFGRFFPAEKCTFPKITIRL
jgi:hypothetical protein